MKNAAPAPTVTEAAPAMTPSAAAAYAVHACAWLGACEGALGDEPAHFRSGCGVSGSAGPQRRLDGRRRCERGARSVVDHLGHDVAVGAEHREARPLGGTGDLLADPPVPAVFQLVRTCLCHSYFAAFPALRRTTSPV